MDDVLYVSLEGKKNFRIGDFLIDDSISLPVFVGENKNISPDDITPENIITGMIKVLIDDPENENRDYYREFIINVNPDIEKRLTNVAYESSSNKNYDEAIEIYKILYFLKPDYIDHILNLAICYDDYSAYLFSQGKENEGDKLEDLAYELYKQIDEIEEKNDKAYFFLGRFYLIRENYVKSLEYFKEFLNISDDEDRIEEVKKLIKDINNCGLLNEDYQMAIQLIQSDKDRDAIEFLDKYIKQFPDSWNGYFLKGISLRKLYIYDEAVANLEKSFELNSNSPDILNELGLCYMSMKMFHKSMQKFYNALRYKPDDINIIYNMAVCSMNKGDMQEALKYCDVILEYEPGDLNAAQLKKVILEEK